MPGKTGKTPKKATQRAFLALQIQVVPAQILGFTFFITAPAHLHATSVAVYPALFPFE